MGAPHLDSEMWELRPRLSRYGYSGGKLRHQLCHAIGELRALADPVLDALMLQRDSGRVGAGIVGAHDFDRTPVASAILLNNYDTVIRLLGGANARQTNHDHGDTLPFKLRANPELCIFAAL